MAKWFSRLRRSAAASTRTRKADWPPEVSSRVVMVPVRGTARLMVLV